MAFLTLHVLCVADIGNYGPRVTTQTLNVTTGNVAFIRCPPIDSVPPRQVLFEKDGITITDSQGRAQINYSLQTYIPRFLRYCMYFVITHDNHFNVMSHSFVYFEIIRYSQVAR